VARTLLFIVAMMLPVGLANWLADANYMYLCARPEVNNPLVIGAWPWYIVNILAIGWVLMLIAALPMQWLHRRAK